MDRSTPFYLIATTISTDAYGVQTKTETRKQVFGQVDSVSASEFFEGGRNGLAPELRFRMFRHDYSGEVIVEYELKRYSVYRTYRTRDDTIELYVERKKGTADG